MQTRPKPAPSGFIPANPQFFAFSAPLPPQPAAIETRVVEKRLTMSERTAYCLLDVHKQLSGLESVSGWDTLPREVLYLLARESTPAEVREEAIERAEAGERLRP
jgi:hypothetical protein